MSKVERQTYESRARLDSGVRRRSYSQNCEITPHHLNTLPWWCIINISNLYTTMLTKVGDCEGYLDMTSTRLSTPSTSGTASKCSTRSKLPRRRCNALCVLVPGQGLCQRARQALISPPHPPPVQGRSQFWAKFPNITPLSFLQHQLQHNEKYFSACMMFQPRYLRQTAHLPISLWKVW